MILILFREYPTWTIVPVVLFSLVTVAVLFSIFHGPTYRTPLVYSALVAVVSQLICAILMLVDFYKMRNPVQIIYPIFYGLKPVYHLFEAAYISFMFVPGLIAFGKISKNRNSKVGVITSYFGYVWATIITLVGLALMILILTKLPSSDEFYPTDFLTGFVDIIDFSPLDVFFKVSNFIYYSNWALVAASLVHHVTQFRALKGKPRITLMVYSAMNIITAIVITVIPLPYQEIGVYDNIIAIMVCTFVFVNFTSVVAILLAVQYGHLWDYDKIQVRYQDLDIDEKSSV